MQSEFEKYLKNSQHFADVINTHRAATAEVIAAIIGLLVENNHVALPAVRKLLKGLENPTGHLSIDISRRDLAARITDRLSR